MDKRKVAVELRRLAKQLMCLAGKEYVVWGIPEGKSQEELLLTKFKNKPIVNKGMAKKLAEWLVNKHNARKVRLQEVDLTGEFDWMKEIGLKAHDRLAKTLTSGELLRHSNVNADKYFDKEYKKIKNQFEVMRHELEWVEKGEWSGLEASDTIQFLRNYMQEMARGLNMVAKDLARLQTKVKNYDK